MSQPLRSFEALSLYIVHDLTALKDVHFRIGGAAGSQLEASDCPKLTGSVNRNCMAGSLMLQLTTKSSGYFENVWAWTADHELDGGPSQTQIDIYVARGIYEPGINCLPLCMILTLM